MQSVAQIDLLLLRSAGKETPSGVPRAFRHEAAQRARCEEGTHAHGVL